jgi:hypothetical protein
MIDFAKRVKPDDPKSIFTNPSRGFDINDSEDKGDSKLPLYTGEDVRKFLAEHRVKGESKKLAMELRRAWEQYSTYEFSWHPYVICAFVRLCVCAHCMTKI